MQPNDIPARFLDDSWFNEYAEVVAAHVILDPEDGRIAYRCKDEHWSEAHAAWCRSIRKGERSPEPWPSGHVAFLRPMSFGRVPAHYEGEQLRLATRRATRNRVVNSLSGGWDRDLRKTREGMRTLARIVRATVDARCSGREAGASPFVACILTTA